MDSWTWTTYVVIFFFFNDTATTEIYTLSLHDALPIFAERIDAYQRSLLEVDRRLRAKPQTITYIDQTNSLTTCRQALPEMAADRKSTRLNSSHANISYAVFCLKKKQIMPDHLYSNYAI